MKNLVKLAIACLAFLSITTMAKAQIKIGASLGAAVPMGDFSDGANTGLGGSLTGKYLINKNMGVGLNVGFYSFGEKTDGFKNKLTPVSGSFTYYFNSNTGNFKPYVGADLGFYTWKYDYETYEYVYTTTYPYYATVSNSISDSETKIGIASTVGFEYSFNDQLALDVNAKYHYVATSGDALTMFGINAGIAYNLGK